MMYTLVVLMAAGKSKRFEGIKQLADINGLPMVNHALSRYRQGNTYLDGIDELIVVLGANTELIQSVLPDNVNHHFAPCWEAGMGSSIANVVKQLPSKVTHVLVGLADQVAIQQSSIRKLLLSSQQQPNLIIAAKYGQTIGAPAIFPKRFFAQLAKLSGDRGAGMLIKKHQSECLALSMPAASLDIDYRHQLIDYLQRQSSP